MATKKRYWLKVKENFFDDDEIVFLKSQENGYEYIYLWQRLLLKCLRSDEEQQCGFLRINEKVPYDINILSELFGMNIDVVRVGIEIFQKMGMLEILEDGTYYIEAVQKMIGKETDSAERMRLHRARREKIMLSHSDKKVTTKIDNINKEKEKKKEVNSEALKITNQFYNDLIKFVNPSCYHTNKPNLENWSEHIRLLNERDGVPYTEMKYVWMWAMADNFWKSNILSTDKFRKQYDRLKIQMSNKQPEKEYKDTCINAKDIKI